MKRLYIFAVLITLCFFGFSQENGQDSGPGYKKRVLENTEIDILMGYYSQDGDHAAVTGGRGTEEMTDLNPTIVVAVPLSDDDVLKIDIGVSAYSSASSSNIDPFDGNGRADPFVASSGASSKDTRIMFSGAYSHQSDDRNKIWSANLSFSTEYDYTSIGFGANYSRLFNEKNTELSVSGNVFLDSWKPLYPRELRPFAQDGSGLDDPWFLERDITGEANYTPGFAIPEDKNRNSYSVGFGFSQIFSQKVQGSLALDFVSQTGLLSTPFQRVYFADVGDSFIEEFHLADAVEQLPDSRFKVAVGGRMNYYLNEWLVVRSFYRYYMDDWGINSLTASIELPFKISDRFTLTPSYRFYNQSEADYFAPYNEHLSSQTYYTSDYDLSDFSAQQYGFKVSYTDIFTDFHIYRFKLKSVDVKILQYRRNTGLNAMILSAGIKFIY